MVSLGEASFGGAVKLPMPEKFSNEFGDWQNWSRRFKMFVGLYMPEIKELFRRCEVLDGVITDDHLTVEVLGTEEARKNAILFPRKLRSNSLKWRKRFAISSIFSKSDGCLRKIVT